MSTGEPRFGMLETVREYALELLGEERQAPALAMAAYLAVVAEEVEVEARTHAQALAKLDPEIDNVRAGLDACAEAGAAELELRLAGGIWRYWWVRGLGARKVSARIERALGSAATTRRAWPGRRRCAARQGSRGSWATSPTRDEPRRGGDPGRGRGQARPGTRWPRTRCSGSSRTSERRSCARAPPPSRSMELAEELGIEPVVREAQPRACIALDDGDHAEAQIMFEDVLAIHRRNENVEGIGTALLNLGVVHYALGEHEASLRDFEEARACFEEVGFRAHVAHAVQGLAACAASEGRFEEAARLLGQARGELDEIGVAGGRLRVRHGRLDERSGRARRSARTRSTRRTRPAARAAARARRRRSRRLRCTGGAP